MEVKVAPDQVAVYRLALHLLYSTSQFFRPDCKKPRKSMRIKERQDGRKRESVAIIQMYGLMKK